MDRGMEIVCSRVEWGLLQAQKRLSDVEEVDPFDAVDEVKTLKHKMFQTMASYEERIRQQYESTAESYREQADLMLGKMEVCCWLLISTVV